MFDMFVREYFDNSLIPLSDTIETFVFRRDNIVQAGNRTAIYQDKSCHKTTCCFWIKYLSDVVCHPNAPKRPVSRTDQNRFLLAFLNNKPLPDISYVRYLHLPST